MSATMGESVPPGSRRRGASVVAHLPRSGTSVSAGSLHLKTNQITPPLNKDGLFDWLQEGRTLTRGEGVRKAPWDFGSGGAWGGRG